VTSYGSSAAGVLRVWGMDEAGDVVFADGNGIYYFVAPNSAPQTVNCAPIAIGNRWYCTAGGALIRTGLGSGADLCAVASDGGAVDAGESQGGADRGGVEAGVNDASGTIVLDATIMGDAQTTGTTSPMTDGGGTSALDAAVADTGGTAGATTDGGGAEDAAQAVSDAADASDAMLNVGTSSAGGGGSSGGCSLSSGASQGESDFAWTMGLAGVLYAARTRRRRPSAATAPGKGG
jgi:MYXO-CTERM domain-containing protein